MVGAIDSSGKSLFLLASLLLEGGESTARRFFESAMVALVLINRTVNVVEIDKVEEKVNFKKTRLLSKAVERNVGNMPSQIESFDNRLSLSPPSIRIQDDGPFRASFRPLFHILHTHSSFVMTQMPASRDLL